MTSRGEATLERAAPQVAAGGRAEVGMRQVLEDLARHISEPLAEAPLG